MHSLARQFSRFSLVGVVATIVHYSLMALLVELLAVHPVVATAVAFLTALAVSYVLNYKITFKSTSRHRAALPRFATVGTVGLALNSLLVAALTGPADLHWLPAQMVTTLIVLCWNFGANRLWTFGERAETATK